MTSKNTSLPSRIEGVSGKHAISELWKSHFGRLLNVIQDDGLCDISCDTKYSDDIRVILKLRDRFRLSKYTIKMFGDHKYFYLTLL